MKRFLFPLLIFLSQSTFAMDATKTVLANSHREAEKALSSLLQEETVTVKEIEALLKKGASVDQTEYIEGYGGCTPLEIAAIYNHKDACAFFLKRLTKDSRPSRVLEYACTLGHPEIVRTIFASGAKVSAATDKMYLKIAGEKNDRELFTLLQSFGIQEGRIRYLLDEDEERQFNELMKLLEQENVNLIRLEQLIDEGTPLNFVRTVEETSYCPLSYAAKHGQAEACRLLIEKGNMEANGLYEAAYVNDLVKYMRKTFITYPIVHACGEGHLQVVNLLLEQGATISRGGTETFAIEGKEISLYYTPLKAAIINGREAIVEALLNSKLTLSYQEWKVITPLFVAIYSQRTSIVKLLLERGHDPNKKNEYIGRNVEFFMLPLELAVSRGNVAICELLIEHGADIHVRFDRATLLHIAAEADNPELCALLLRAGADICAQNAQGQTALESAAIKGNIAVCIDLLKHNRLPIPIVEEGEAGKEAEETISMLKRLSFSATEKPLPRDVCFEILKYLPDLCESFARYCINRLQANEPFEVHYLPVILPCVTTYRMQKLIPLMTAARANAVANAVDAAIISLLDPANVENLRPALTKTSKEIIEAFIEHKKQERPRNNEPPSQEGQEETISNGQFIIGLAILSSVVITPIALMAWLTKRIMKIAKIHTQLREVIDKEKVDLQEVRSLLEACGPYIYYPNGDSLFARAIQHGHRKVGLLLLEKGYSPTFQEVTTLLELEK